MGNINVEVVFKEEKGVSFDTLNITSHLSVSMKRRVDAREWGTVQGCATIKDVLLQELEDQLKTIKLKGQSQ